MRTLVVVDVQIPFCMYTYSPSALSVIRHFARFGKSNSVAVERLDAVFRDAMLTAAVAYYLVKCCDAAMVLPYQVTETRRSAADHFGATLLACPVTDLGWCVQRPW